MSDKAKKIIGVVANAIVVVILVLVAFITLNIILSRGQGYTSIFGKAYVSVQSDSMEGNQPDSFKKGDFIKIKILKDEEKSKLQVGDVITFRFRKDNEEVLNTHRIIAVNQSGTGVTYTTQGDKAAMLGVDEQIELVYTSAVVGKYTGSKIGGFGKVVDFFHTSAGFFVFVVLPSLLIVAYFAVNLVMTVRAAKAAEAAETAAVSQEDEREKMRRELLAELRAEGKLEAEPDQTAPPAESEPTEEPTEDEPVDEPADENTEEDGPAPSEPEKTE